MILTTDPLAGAAMRRVAAGCPVDRAIPLPSWSGESKETSMPRTPSARPWWKRSAVIGPAAAVVLAAVMIQQTTVLGAGEEISSAEGSSTEEAAELARENCESSALAGLREEPVPPPGPADAAGGDPVKAGEQYGRHEAEGKPYSYAVTASGTVTEGEFGEIGLEIDGMPDGMDVGIAVPPFGSSTALRDYGLDVQYGDFENQIAYQRVAIELNAL